MSYESTYSTIDFQEYSMIFAMDWSFSSESAIARKRRGSNKIYQTKVASDLKSLIKYFSQFKGKKLLVLEETTGAHWLYVNLLSVIDRIIICDPHRNSLMKEGSKTDKIDALKLMHLLLSNSLKEVYHSNSDLYELRSFMSSYFDLDKAIVRLKNQIAAFKRSKGVRKNNKDFKPKSKLELFVYENQLALLKEYEKKKAEYEVQMRRLIRRYPIAKNLMTIGGVGIVISLTIYSTVIEPGRFEDKYKYYSYCGLVLLLKESGKSIKGKRRGHYNPLMKWAYKSAALAAINGKNDIHDYYMYLLGKGYPESVARNEVARYICRVSLAMMKNGTKYQPYSWRHAM